MGTLKTIGTVSNPKGKFDFNTQTLRRETNGKLERNKIKTTLKTAYTNNYIDLSGNMYECHLNLSEIPVNSAPFIGVADYVNNKGFFATLILVNNGDSYMRFYVMKNASPTTVTLQQSDIYLGNFGTLDPDVKHDVVVKFDFTTLAVYSATVDGIEVTPSYYAEITDTVFIHKTNTLSFGALPWDRPVPLSTSITETSFFQLKDEQGFILLSFDFLGDNETEILTDKAKLITLINDGAVIIPDPITI